MKVRGSIYLAQIGVGCHCENGHEIMSCTK